MKVLVLLLVLVAFTEAQRPEEVCPCQPEESCGGDRHVFGREATDIQNFGVIQPCRTFGHFPCCPEKPPPPREIKLTAKDFQGLSHAELVQLGVINERGTIGSSTLPLSQQEQFRLMAQQRQQFPIDINQPGAASLAPAGATLPGRPGFPSPAGSSLWSPPVAAPQAPNFMYRPAYVQPYPPHPLNMMRPPFMHPGR